MKKLSAFFFVGLCLVGLSSAQEKKFQISLVGGVNQVFKYGSEGDYKIGENDFPVTPSHVTPGLGVSLAYLLSKRWAVEWEVVYYLRAKITLEDPSDKDTVDIKSARHISGALSLLFYSTGHKLRPYFASGGGFDRFLGKNETYTSKNGFEVEVTAPEKKFNAFIHAKAGAQYFFAQQTGARLEVRYVLLFDAPDIIDSLNLLAGIFIRF